MGAFRKLYWKCSLISFFSKVKEWHNFFCCVGETLGGLGDLQVQRGLPGIGEFQCYDKFMMESLKLAAEEVNEEEWCAALLSCVLCSTSCCHSSTGCGEQVARSKMCACSELH